MIAVFVRVKSSALSSSPTIYAAPATETSAWMSHLVMRTTVADTRGLAHNYTTKSNASLSSGPPKKGRNKWVCSRTPNGACSKVERRSSQPAQIRCARIESGPMRWNDLRGCANRTESHDLALRWGRLCLGSLVPVLKEAREPAQVGC